MDTESKRQFPWQALSVTVAVLSLGAAVLFNAFAVRAGARQQQLSRQSSELGTLFQVEQAVRRSSSVIYSKELSDAPAEELERNTLSRVRRKLIVAMNDFDYVGFLFNHGYLTIQGARGRWQNDLTCAWELAVLDLPVTAPAFWGELAKFARHGVCDGPGGRTKVDDIEARAKQLREMLSASDS